MLSITSSLSQKERQTFKLHLIYSLIEGVILGVLALNEYVFLKSLHGSEYQLSILFQLSMVVFVFLILINEFLRRIKNHKRLLRITGFLTRGPLLFLLFFPTSHSEVVAHPIYHVVFLFIFFIYFMGNTVIYPTINLFLKNVYSHKNFGTLYSYTQSLNKIVLMFVTLGYGILLDGNNFIFREIFAVVAVLGIASLYLLSFIPYTAPSAQMVVYSGFFHSLKNSALRMWDIITKNRPYLHFEVGFMLYGFAFMATATVINIFFERGLGLNYSSYAFYKNIYNVLAILMLPMFGKLLGRIDPRKFAAITYTSMLIYLLFMAATEYYPFFWETPQFSIAGFVIPELHLYPMLLISYLSYSVFAATMPLLWSIGSAYFCKKEEAGDYQSVHLSLTGVRAMFAPIVGVLIFEVAGFSFTFFVGALSLLLAVFVMLWSFKRYAQKLGE